MTPPKIEKKEWTILTSSDYYVDHYVDGTLISYPDIQKVINAEYVSELEQKCRDYEEALKFYSDQKNFDFNDPGYEEIMKGGRISTSFGEFASEVLKKHGVENDKELETKG